MIEIRGDIFLEDILLIRIQEVLPDERFELRDYTVKVVVRDGDGEHAYQRVMKNVPRFQVNILGLMQIAFDELPPEAFKTDKGMWVPRGRQTPLEQLLP